MDSDRSPPGLRSLSNTKEHAAGNYDAKNWQDEARKVIEKTVSVRNSYKIYD